MTIKLSEVVSQFLDESNLGQAEYAKAYRIAIRGLRDIGWDITARVKTEEIVFGDNLTALYPIDCVKIIDFGISDGTGGIASYDKVNSITNNSSVDVYQNYNYGLDIYPDRNNTIYDNYPLNTYTSLGIGSYNSIGKYTVDEKSKTILLAPNSNHTKFLIKYLSYETEDCEYEVHIMASEALLCFIRWKFSMTGTRNTLNVQEQNKREYYREKTNAKLRIKMPIIQQLNKSARESVKMAVKS